MHEHMCVYVHEHVHDGYTSRLCVSPSRPSFPIRSFELLNDDAPLLTVHGYKLQTRQGARSSRQLGWALNNRQRRGAACATCCWSHRPLWTGSRVRFPARRVGPAVSRQVAVSRAMVRARQSVCVCPSICVVVLQSQMYQRPRKLPGKRTPATSLTPKSEL